MPKNGIEFNFKHRLTTSLYKKAKNSNKNNKFMIAIHRLEYQQPKRLILSNDYS